MVVILTSVSSTRAHFISELIRMLPGITLVAVVTGAAYGLRQIPGLNAVNPMFSSMLIGLVFANFTTVPQPAVPGVYLLAKKMLRFAVALIGLQLTVTQVVEVGAVGMLLLTLIVALTYGFTLTAAHWLGISPSFARLLAAGTSICGASAIAAANSIEQASEEEVSYAIACVTLFGTLAMAGYPMLASLLNMDVLAYGFWTGASVHEVAQVVATGFLRGTEAGEFALVVKLSRVLLLAPLLIVVVFFAARRDRDRNNLLLGKAKVFPVFIACFIGLMLANTAGIVPEMIRGSVVQTTPVMLTAALGALGLGTNFDALLAKGAGPLLLAAVASAFISLASLLALPLL